MTREMIVRNGYMKFWRLGPIEFGEQSRWGRAPKSRGMWAFPYPFYDVFFTYHKYLDLLPKRLKDEKDVTYEEQEQWIKTVGRKVLPIREFWYRGDVYTHFTPSGAVADPGTLSGKTDWSITDVTRLKKFITSSGGNSSLYRYAENEKPVKVRTSVDHLEVFIAPNMGTIRHNLK